MHLEFDTGHPILDSLDNFVQHFFEPNPYRMEIHCEGFLDCLGKGEIIQAFLYFLDGC